MGFVQCLLHVALVVQDWTLFKCSHLVLALPQTLASREGPKQLPDYYV